MNSLPGWKLTNISDICEAIIDCVNRTAPVVDYVTPYKMIRTTNVKRGRIDTNDVKYVTEETYKRWSRRGELRHKDVILTREAPLGEVGMMRDDDAIFMGQRLVMYRANCELLVPEFLLYAMQERFIQGQIRAFGSGSTVEHMRVPDAKAIQVLLPPLEIQQKIAAILSAYDDLIENNQRRIKLLEQAARDLYQEWFVHFRFPGHEQVELVDRELGRLPANWRTTILRDICSYINRGIAPKYDETAENIVINQRCIRDGRLNLNIARRNARTVPSEKLVQIGDILVNSTGEGTLGRVAQVDEDISNCTVDSHVSIVRPIEPKHRDYLAWYMLEKQPELARMGEGATNQTELTRSRLGALKLLLPTEELAEHFSQLVSPVRREVTILQKKNDVLASMRDLLLPRLISGELDVSDISIASLETPEESEIV